MTSTVHTSTSHICCAIWNTWFFCEIDFFSWSSWPEVPSPRSLNCFYFSGAFLKNPCNFVKVLWRAISLVNIHAIPEEIKIPLLKYRPSRWIWLKVHGVILKSFIKDSKIPRPLPYSCKNLGAQLIHGGHENSLCRRNMSTYTQRNGVWVTNTMRPLSSCRWISD